MTATTMYDVPVTVSVRASSPGEAIETAKDAVAHVNDDVLTEDDHAFVDGYPMPMGQCRPYSQLVQCGAADSARQISDLARDVLDRTWNGHETPAGPSIPQSFINQVRDSRTLAEAILKMNRQVHECDCMGH